MEKVSRGHPRKFKTAEELKDKFMAYIKTCENKNRLPNVAGFCVFCDMVRCTYYEQDKYYSDTFKKIELVLEDATLNAKIPTAEKIFYLKNKFKEHYRDKQEYEHTGQMPVMLVDDIDGKD